MIKLINVSKYYHTDVSVNLGLKKVNLEFHKGEFVAITGQSGSGKSTLLNVISGLDSYEDGEMYIDGEPTSHYDEADWMEYRKNKIGFIFQDYNLIEGYSVLENVYSVLLTKDINVKEARKRALSILKRVGLIDIINQKAAKLSSGQKQRLSIARALAKDTQIIVADEPTGNLDAENGMHIMQLLHEISKDKLVIVVTHNAEQVKDIATRRIILHDGCVVDEIIEKSYQAITISEESLENSENNNEKKNNMLSIALQFLRMDIKAHPKRFITILMLMLIITLASFMFIGVIYLNMDDSSTKIVNNKVFKNIDKCRIVVRNKTGEAMSDEQLNTIASLPNVALVNKNCIANDFNYYYLEGIDYINDVVTKQKDDNISVRANNIKFLINNNFMLSIGNLGKEALRLGEIPQKLDEIVLYSDNDALINSVIRVYFINGYSWEKDIYFSMDMRVVGLLKKPQKQIYFSDRLLNSLATANEPELVIYLSNNYMAPLFNALLLPYNFETLGLDKHSDEIVLSESILNRYNSSSINYLTLEKFQDKTKTYEHKFDNISEAYHNQPNNIVLVNDEYFYELYNATDIKECSVFADDELNVKGIISELRKLGFDSISPYKMAGNKYDMNKVRERLITLGILFFSIIMMLILEVLIIQSMIRFNKNDFIILKSMGMNNGLICLINYLEMLMCYIIAVLITIAIVCICYNQGVSLFTNMLRYFEINGYIWFAGLNLFTAIISAYLYNKYLSKKVKITSLKEV